MSIRIATLALLALLGAAPAVAQQPIPAEGLKPGLAALYFDGDFKHVGSMPKGADAKKQGRPGPAVAMLDEISPSGRILDAKGTELYGIQLDGFIKLPAGETVLVVNSNDGVRVFLAGKMVIDDPDVHADRMSLPAQVKLPREGWYPLQIQYFQRKNTAALQLFWQPAGAANMDLVPAEALAHKP